MPLRSPLLALACLAAGPALAQDGDAPSAAKADGTGIHVELNTLRQVDSGCQAYFVVSNGGAAVSAIELYAVMFGPDGIIRDDLVLPFPPVDAGRMKVVPLTLRLGCEEIGRIFINEVRTCEAADGACAGRLSFSSRGPTGLGD